MEQQVNGLVLAGGGAKGSYQVGVWKALQSLDWQPGVITGTSVGSLNGALFTQGSWQGARDMWLTLDDSNVMTLPGSKRPKELAEFLAQTVRQGGLNVAPLEQLVDRMLCEDRIRSAGIRFGLVTVNVSDLRPMELSVQEIPQGQLPDYLLASASFFPGFKPRDIDGKTFIDGGYTDNMPTALAARLGATNLVCVNVDGIGVQRRNTTGLPTLTVESHWDLGPILRFDPQQARRNIALGYWDTYRAFGRLLGSAYAIDASQRHPLNRRFTVPYVTHLEKLIHTNPTLAITEKLAVDWFDPSRDPQLAPLELALREVGVDPTRLYTADSLAAEFLKRYDPQRAQRYGTLLDSQPTLDLVGAAKASAQPAEFVTALVWRALSSTDP